MKDIRYYWHRYWLSENKRDAIIFQEELDKSIQLQKKHIHGMEKYD